MKRITTTALLLAMLLSLYGCGGGENPEKENVDTDNTTTQTESTETETETEDLFAAYRNINLGGRTVHISVSSNISEGGGGMPSSYPYIAGPEEMTGEAVADSVYTRNQNVEELLSCKLEHIALDLEYDKVQPYIENMVISGDTAIDYYVNDQFGLLHCGVKGYLLDLNKKENFTDYYFDFASGAYYYDYMRGLSIGKKQFIMTGPYFIDTLRAAHVLYMNKNIYADLYGDANGLYEIVKENKWTLDTLNTMVEDAYQDLNGDGNADDGDRYGLSVHSKTWTMPYYAIYYSTDAHVVEFDDKNIPYISESNLERISMTTDKLIRLHQCKGTYKLLTVADSLQKFVDGQSLFTMFQKIGDMEQSSIREFDGMGMVPYPLLDETQDHYRTLIHDTAEMGAVPITSAGEAAAAVSAVVQVLSTDAAQNMVSLYYDTALKSKYAQDSYTAEMLDIVSAGITAPFEFAYEFAFGGDSYLNGISFMPVADSITKGTNITASSFAKKLPRAQEKLAKLVEIYTED